MLCQESIFLPLRSSLLWLASPPDFLDREHRVSHTGNLSGGVRLADYLTQLFRLPIVILAQRAVRRARAVIQDGRFQHVLCRPVPSLAKPPVADFAGGVPVGRGHANEGGELAGARQLFDRGDLTTKVRGR